MPGIRATLLILLISCLSLNSVASELENMLDYVEPSRMPYYGENYMPYPPQPTVAPQQVQPEKKPWYRRIMNPFVKRMSPPIYQVPKVSEGKPKETVELPEPLIRMAKGVSYQNREVAPGFYLLKLEHGASDQEDFLLLMREQREVLRVPALVSFGSLSGESRQARGHNGTPRGASPTDSEKSADKSRDKNPTERDTTGTVKLSEDGKSMILVYLDRDKQYISLPLTVSRSWQP